MGKFQRAFSFGKPSANRQDSGQQHKRSKSKRGSISAFLAAVGLTGSHSKASYRKNRTGPTTKLTDLPNELLLCIIDYLRIDLPRVIKEERFDGQERLRYVQQARDLVHLSSTCKTLRPVAQKALLHTIVLGGFDGLPAIVSLVRLLLDRPEAHSYVRRLRIGIPPDKKYYCTPYNQMMKRIPFGPPPSDIWLSAAEVIAHSPLPTSLKHDWQEALSSNHPRPLCGVLLALVPRLQHLSISHSLGRVSGDQVLRQMFGGHDGNSVIELGALPVFGNLTYFNNNTTPRLRPSLSHPLQRTGR
ncbi:hypothetical protein BKA63DRAFT_169283 [Paraphoma chrysanthemicola]|nr:hypothetical protein BKA63DRAFT_169283 [Paraphoma chrysanthemicola]